MADVPALERGRLQVLYRYAPLATVFHERAGQAEIVQTLHMDSGLREPPNVDAEQVKDRIKQDLWLFQDSELRADEVDYYDLKVIRPDNAYTFIHPAVWFCPNPACRRLYVPPIRLKDRRDKQLEGILEHLPTHLLCQDKIKGAPCNTRLRQYTWLTTHNCGEEIVVPRENQCFRHKDRFLHWYDQGSEKVRDWRIVCEAEGCEWDTDAFRSFMKIHSGCPLSGNLEGVKARFDTAPLQKATHHMGRVLNLLNSGYDHRSILSDADDAARAALGVMRDAAAFSTYDPYAGFDVWRRSFNPDRKGGSDTGDELKKWMQAKQGVMMIPDTQARTAALEPIEAKIKSLTSDGEGIPYSEVVDLAEDNEYKRQMRDAAIFLHDGNGYGLDRIAASAVDTTHKSEIETAQQLLTNLGIADIRYVESVPLTSVLTGYMRGSYDFADTSLRFYLDGNQLKVYANDGSTEAIWIQFDPSKTLAWLARKTGTTVTVSGDYTKDLFELQKRYDPQARRAFGRIEDPWTKEHTALLHSLSHVLIKSLGKHSGLELEGLSEEILPFANGILIYANQSGEFTLGGLQIVFEHHLRAVADSLLDEAARCVYNPICDHDLASACHGCIHLGEVSCSHFNKLLDRTHLIGPNGFWSTP